MGDIISVKTYLYSTPAIQNQQVTFHVVIFGLNVQCWVDDYDLGRALIEQGLIINSSLTISGRFHQLKETLLRHMRPVMQVTNVSILPYTIPAYSPLWSGRKRRYSSHEEDQKGGVDLVNAYRRCRPRHRSDQETNREEKEAEPTEPEEDNASTTSKIPECFNQRLSPLSSPVQISPQTFVSLQGYICHCDASTYFIYIYGRLSLLKDKTAINFEEASRLLNEMYALYLKPVKKQEAEHFATRAKVLMEMIRISERRDDIPGVIDSDYLCPLPREIFDVLHE
ncbi:hypothetical protein BDF14DRAFT_1885570 [Spinellus fusiger]|nr:hypothetical protein BDF14DRAFT_1885570 [Spinellus fusiger]